MTLLNINSFYGINSKCTDIESKYLLKADNVFITNENNIYPRYNLQLIDNGNYHSFFKFLNYIFMVRDNVLFEYTTNTILDNVSNIVKYAQISDIIYFTDGVLLKKIYNLKSIDLFPTTKNNLDIMPPGNDLAIYKSRLFVAVNDFIYVSNAFDYDHYDKKTGWIKVNSKVYMLASVSNGLYVSDNSGTWFIYDSWPEIKRKNLLKEISFSYTYIPLKYKKGEVAFITENGIYIGDGDGNIQNITIDKIDITNKKGDLLFFIQYVEEDGQLLEIPQILYSY